MIIVSICLSYRLKEQEAARMERLSRIGPHVDIWKYDHLLSRSHNHKYCTIHQYSFFRYENGTVRVL